MAIEKEIDDTWSIRDVGASEKKKENQSSSTSGKKQRTFASRGFQGQGQGYQGQGQVKASSQTGQMTCYHCHMPRHMRRDCPQRQGSQGYGTPQSQSSVGHEQTQFVSPYPSTGQGNQYQSQGVAQALVISQTG